MPVITITLIEGYDEATRRALSARLTDVVRSSIGAPLEGITVIVNELSAANYMRGRSARIPGAPPPAPSQVVRDFLAAMERRDLSAAGAFLAEGFTMTFPGGASFSRLQDLVTWAGDRYRSVAKSYEQIDEAVSAEGTVVYCFGTLSGVWLDGSSFSGVRFIDRITVVDGKLVDQRVWNDLAELRAGSA
jgi:4-oxalocrotonate tautomerase family enzyme